MRWAAVLLLLLGGCAARQVPPGDPPHPGDPAAEPTMEALPEPDVPREDMTRRMRFAWLLAEQSFELPDPPPPPSPTMAQLQRWSDTHLEPWLARKSDLVEAARNELDVAAEQSHRQRIVAGALVGLMYEDVLRVLDGVPVPRELEDDPEIREVYREVVEFQAAPYLHHARNAYRACSANAVRPRGMRHWSAFCAARLDRLPADEDLASGETEVTVTVEP
ncbi:MAG: hypothetical protein ACODAU_05265 [Myxococcota bacterium]